MRRWLLACALTALTALPAQAQILDPPGQVQVSAAGATCATANACAVYPLGSMPSITLQIVGTFSATLQFEATADGQTWVSVMTVNTADGSSATSTTSTGAFSFANSGFQQIRVRASAYASGAASVTGVRGWSLARWLTPYFRSLTVERNAIGTTSTDGIRVENNTAAAAGAQQYSPRSCWEGQGWKTDATAASQSVVFCVETQPVQGASAPTGNWILKASINGGAFSTVGTFSSAGAFATTTGAFSGAVGVNGATVGFDDFTVKARGSGFGFQLMPSGGGQGALVGFRQTTSAGGRIFVRAVFNGSDTAEIDGDTGLIRSNSTGGIGYGTGAGGTVTQATDKTTGVELNKTSGQITMNNAALAAAAEACFVVTNSRVAAADTVSINHGSAGTAGAYIAYIGAVGAGSFTACVSNITGGSLSEAIVLNFNVIKGASS